MDKAQRTAAVEKVLFGAATDLRSSEEVTPVYTADQISGRYTSRQMGKILYGEDNQDGPCTEEQPCDHCNWMEKEGDKLLLEDAAKEAEDIEKSNFDAEQKAEDEYLKNWRESVVDEIPEYPTDTVGRKDDAGKPRPLLLPFKAMNVLLEVLEHGAKKYGADNWRGVDDGYNRYCNAIGRHYFALGSGNTHDVLSNLPHLAHIAASALFALEIATAKEKNRA